MISTVQQLVSLSPVLGLSRWLRTDLILAGTLTFLVCASWAMLRSEGPSRHRGSVGSHSDRDLPVDAPESTREDSPRGRTFETFGIVLGLLSSLALFAICAW